MSPRLRHNVSLATIVACLLACWGCAGYRSKTTVRIIQGEPRRSRYVSPAAYEHYIRARLHENRGETKAAVQQLRQALAFDPESPYLHSEIARLLARTGHLQLAQDHLGQALEANPTFAAALVLRAELHHRAGQLDLAASDYRLAMKSDPTNAQAYVGLARMMETTGQRSEARQVLEQLVSVDSGRMAREQLAQLCLRTLDLPCAAKHYAALVQQSPDIGLLIWLGIVEHARGRAEAAARLLREAFDRSGGSLAVAQPLVDVLRATKQQRAVTDLIDLLERQAVDPDSGARLVQILLRIDRSDRALRLADKLASLGPPSEALSFARASAMYSSGRKEDAKRVLASMISGPHGAAAAIHMARLLYDDGKHADAMAVLREARANNPTDTELVLALAQALMASRRANAAEATIRNALSLGNKHTRALIGNRRSRSGAEAPRWQGARTKGYCSISRSCDAASRDGSAPELSGYVRSDPQLKLALATAVERQGRWRQAVQIADEIIVNHPNNALAQNFVGFILADHGVQFVRAERAIRQALYLAPAEAHLIDSLGWLYFKRGMLAKADATLRIAARLTPEQPEILAHLGEVVAARKRLGDGLRLLRRASALTHDLYLQDKWQNRIRALLGTRYGTASTD